eukprot:905207-Lingulodinium_polyedra.AAC.1
MHSSRVQGTMRCKSADTGGAVLGMSPAVRPEPGGCACRAGTASAKALAGADAAATTVSVAGRPARRNGASAVARRADWALKSHGAR